LVEIAVILGLLGLLSSLGLLAAKKTIRQARTSATIAQMGYIEQALVTLAAHCEGLPIFLGTGDPGLATSAPRCRRLLAGSIYLSMADPHALRHGKLPVPR
jgi:hypothetical protein